MSLPVRSDVGQCRDAWEHFAFQEFERRAAARRHVANLVYDAKLFGGGCGISTTDDGRGTALSCLGHGCSQRFATLGELVELEHTHRSVPNDGFRACDRVGKQLARLRTAVHAFNRIRNAVLVRRVTEIRIVAERIAGLEINRQMDLDALLLGFLDQRFDDFSRLPDRTNSYRSSCHTVLFERVRHAAADDEFVDLVDQVLNQLNLVGYFCAAQDTEERTLRVVQSFAEVFEFLLHE